MKLKVKFTLQNDISGQMSYAEAQRAKNEQSRRVLLCLGKLAPPRRCICCGAPETEVAHD